ncbi:MAG: hypothetical protein PWQ96_1031 [Clostridia bacterium]|nr:hypothetical protein [Clostridiales bacterium]MDK2985389.1 hypothetical protein [Clostridia bacterium]
MDSFAPRFLLVFCTSLGVVLGAALIGSLAAVITGGQPIRIMLKIAYEIKIWAIAAAIGGTFTTIEILESGLFEGELRIVIKQLLYFFSAFLGAQLGYSLIAIIAGGKG